MTALAAEEPDQVLSNRRTEQLGSASREEAHDHGSATGVGDRADHVAATGEFVIGAGFLDAGKARELLERMLERSAGDGANEVVHRDSNRGFCGLPDMRSVDHVAVIDLGDVEGFVCWGDFRSGNHGLNKSLLDRPPPFWFSRASS